MFLTLFTKNFKSLDIGLLFKSVLFSLLGKKEILKSDTDYEVILADATETPVERPKKTKEIVEEEKRLDNMMELDRLNALRIQEEIEKRRHEEQRE